MNDWYSALGIWHVAKCPCIGLHQARLFFTALVWPQSCMLVVCIADHRRPLYSVLYQAEGRTYIFGTAKLSVDVAQPWPRIPQHKRGVQWKKVRNWKGFFDNDYMEFSHHRTSQQQEQKASENHRNHYISINKWHSYFKTRLHSIYDTTIHCKLVISFARLSNSLMVIVILYSLNIGCFHFSG